MLIDLHALLASPDAVPTSVGAGDLLDLHRQLLDRASEDHAYVKAATIVNALSELVTSFDAADPRTVTLVLSHLLHGLRAEPSRPAEDARRFDTAQGWLDHLRMERRTTQLHADR